MLVLLEMYSDVSERGLERLICTALAGHPCDPPAVGTVADPPAGYGGVGWSGGNFHDYEREYCVDLVQLAAFLRDAQPEAAEALALSEDGPTRRAFLTRLQGEVIKRGTIDVLRNGIKHGALHLDLFYGTPSAENPQAQERFEQNRFTVTRQLRYSRDEAQRALDIGLFINGLPVFTFELKNSLTKQTVDDAVLQYQQDRNPREKLFEFGRCIAHFAVDEREVQFCTRLAGKASWFLPFNRGWKDGAGNPPNPDGLAIDYLWREVLTSAGPHRHPGELRPSGGGEGGEERQEAADADLAALPPARRGAPAAGRRRRPRRRPALPDPALGRQRQEQLHRLAGPPTDRADQGRRAGLRLDHRGHRPGHPRPSDPGHDQAVRPGGATVAPAERSGDLRRFIESGKKIIISTVQKFPFILDEIGNEQRGRSFAIIIDEAHSSQGGRASAAMTQALSEAGEVGEEETYEDRINRVMESRRLLPNASYFAFTATPKNRTLEIFGTPDPQPDGMVRHHAFHSYTMKQAIQEGFILDVLAHYTPVASYYRLAKTVEDDPEFDARRAQKKLRRYVEGSDHAISLKAEIMVDHFHDQVLAQNKIGGAARAMVVTNGIERAVQYYHAIRDYLHERKSRYQALVAFSGEHELGGAKVTEASLNGLPSARIAERFREEPYRFLVCADKFQTGYDEPLLHTMYVDKTLSGIKAVQTLSRLNRAHPKKHDVFVLDFLNDADTIREAFADYYRATILADETDPNKLHDLQAELDRAQVYAEEQVEELVRRYLGGDERDRLDPILDACVAVYRSELDEDGQVEFKGGAKAFVRTYAFLSSVLPYTNVEWEKRSIFLNFLIPKLPAPEEPDLSKGILDAIDLDSYRVEKQAMQRIMLPDEDAEIEPVPNGGSGHRAEPELDRLSNILQAFNEHFGDIQWEDADRVRQLIIETIPDRVREDTAFRNAQRNSDRQNARIEHDKALLRVMTAVMRDDTELFKQFMDNDSFKRWMTDTVFSLAYEPAATP